MLLKLKTVSKHYQLGGSTIKALDQIDLEIDQGEFVAIMGPSGSGKSTLLQVASMLAEPTSGSIFLKEHEVTTYDEVERARLRNEEIGFIFQQFNLLPRTSAIDNVRLPLIYAKKTIPEREQRERATNMLIKVDLEDRLENTPAQLSGGQQQRVAIARALVNNPSLVFADEPTGNLDSKSSDEIMQLLVNLHKDGTTIIMVTHEEDVAARAQREIHFMDGNIVSDTKKSRTVSAHKPPSTNKTTNRSKKK